jgi:hypothetical protein
LCQYYYDKGPGLFREFPDPAPNPDQTLDAERPGILPAEEEKIRTAGVETGALRCAHLLTKGDGAH